MTTYYVDPAAAGAANGTSWTDAWTTLQTAADTAVAGDVVYCRGTQNLAAAIDFDTNSGTYNGGYIKFIGCNASGNVDGTYFNLNGQDNNIDGIAITNGKDGVWLENIKIYSCNATAGINCTTAAATNWVFNNVWCHDNDGHGISGGSYLGGDFFQCKFTSNTGSGVINTTVSLFHGCKFASNTSYGHDVGYATTFSGCVFYANGADGVRVQSTPAFFINCTFDDQVGHGINGFLGWANRCVAVNCRFTNQDQASKSGMAETYQTRSTVQNCYFGNNTAAFTGYYDDVPVNGTSYLTTSGSDTNHGYTTAGSVWQLRTDATYRRTAIPIDSSNNSYSSAGLTPTDKRVSEYTNGTAENIKNGVTIDDVTGTYSAGGGGGIWMPRARQVGV